MRRWIAWLFMPCIIWLLSFGPLWLSFPAENIERDQQLRVMTYNTLVINQDIDSIIQTIRESQADLIGFQELSPAMAAELDERLAADYPFRILDIENAALSRYPLERVAGTLPGEWGELSKPQVYRVKVNRNDKGDPQELSWIVAHQFAPIPLGNAHAPRWVLRERKRQSQTITSFCPR